jgi:hypothetical protein
LSIQKIKTLKNEVAISALEKPRLIGLKEMLALRIVKCVNKPIAIRRALKLASFLSGMGFLKINTLGVR